MKKSSLVLIISIIYLIFGSSFINPPVFAQSESQKNTAQQPKTEFKKTEHTWEKIVSLPGRVIYLPFKLIFKGVEKTITIVDESKIAPRVIDVLKSDDGKRALLPTYGARIGGGFQLYQRGLVNPESKLTLTTTVGMRQRQNYQLEFKRIRMAGGLAHVTGQYQMLTDELFFGTGPDSDLANESNYTHEKMTIESGYGITFSKKLFLETTIGFNINNILSGKDKDKQSTTDLYSNQKLLGLGEQVKLGGFLVKLQHDSRNKHGNPTAGHEFVFESGISQEIGNDKFGFWVVNADFSQYIHLFYDRTLVIRAAGRMVAANKDRLIPFYALSELGERETIRGFERGRFRDKDMVLTTAEYRFPLSQNKRNQSGIEAVLFVDGGKISHNIIDEFSLDGFKIGYGGGIRFYGSEGPMAKIEIGKSKEGFRIYFVWN